MNDPGLHEPIQDATQDVEPDEFEREEEKEEEEERDFHDPRCANQSCSSLVCVYIAVLTHCCSRWWFASTACPLVAGTFGPMANAFSICALAAKWQHYIPPGATEPQGQPLPDPAWQVQHRPRSTSRMLIVVRRQAVSRQCHLAHLRAGSQPSSPLEHGSTAVIRGSAAHYDHWLRHGILPPDRSGGRGFDKKL